MNEMNVSLLIFVRFCKNLASIEVNSDIKELIELVESFEAKIILLCRVFMLLIICKRSST